MIELVKYNWIVPIEWIADVRVEGKPVTKKRKHHHDPTEHAYKELVAMTFRQANPRYEMPPPDTRLACWIAWERGRLKKGGEPKAKMDIDNIRKSVQDALNGVAYVDDSQIKHELGIEVLVPYKEDAVYIAIGVIKERNHD